MSLYREKLLKLIKNKNFINSQNYVLGKKIINKVKSSINITKNGENMIGYDYSEKIQEINIYKLNNENNKLKLFFILFFSIFFIVIFFDISKNGFNKDNIQYLISVIIFMLIFIPPWFISFGKNNNFNFYRNYQKIIIYNKK